MSPLSIEAVYERVPSGPERDAPAAVRFGLRAVVGSAADDAAARQSAAGRRESASGAAEQGKLVRFDGASRRGPGRGPREALDEGTVLLGYSGTGRPIPLTGLAGNPHLEGRFVDMRA